MRKTQANRNTKRDAVKLLSAPRQEEDNDLGQVILYVLVCLLLEMKSRIVYISLVDMKKKTKMLIFALGNIPLQSLRSSMTMVADSMRNKNQSREVLFILFI